MQGSRRIRSLTFAAVGILSCLGLPTAPGSGKPFLTDQVLREPKGLPFVVVEDQALTVDLRPIPSGQNPVVDAVYHLHNEGEARRAELVFTTDGSALLTGKVTFDRQVLQPTWNKTVTDLPAGWAVPSTVPDPTGDGTGVLPYRGPPGLVTTRYAVEIPPGHHVLRVNFQVNAFVYHGDAPTRAWRFVYGLAPGRHWGGRGKAEVLIRVPPGWLASSTPAYRRVGDDLRGELDFAADHLAVTTQAPWEWPAGREALLTGIWAGAALGGLVLCPVCGRQVGRFLRRTGRPRPWAWLPSFGVAFVGTLALGTLVGLVYYHRGAPVGQEAKPDLVLARLLLLAVMHLFTLAAFPVYLLLMQLGVSLAWKRRRAADIPEVLPVRRDELRRPRQADRPPEAQAEVPPLGPDRLSSRTAIDEKTRCYLCGKRLQREELRSRVCRACQS
jgi:hypothetical protein